VTTGLIVVAAVLALGTAIGLWRRRTDGRFHATAPAGPPHVQASPPVSTAAASTAPVPASVAASGAPGSVSSLPAAEGVPAADGTVPIVGAHPSEADAGPRVVDEALLHALGVGPARATLLQFSSAFCAPCRVVRRVSSEVAAMVPGVQHVEVDAESHLDAVRALGIWRTPTLLVLDADGRVVKRATGVPAKSQLIAVLGEVLT
jgi:thiol-disulfide isomerase/thioredoxin